MKTNRYPVLRIVATIYKVIGIILAILTLLIACSAPFLGGSMMRETGLNMGRGGLISGLIFGFVVLLYGGFGSLFIYATGEVFTLLIDLEANTRLTASLLERGER